MNDRVRLSLTCHVRESMEESIEAQFSALT